MRGLWGLSAEVWTPSCATKAAWLDVARVYLRLGQSAGRGEENLLPELPRGQRIELDVLGTNDIDLTLEARVRQVLTAQTEIDQEDEALADEQQTATTGAEPPTPPAALQPDADTTPVDNGTS